MNAKQRKQIISIIKEDAEITCNYLNMAGQTCVLGGLALAAKVPRKTLLMAGVDGIQVGNRSVTRISKAIQKKFGLTLYQQAILQSINDKEDERSDRQRCLIANVKEIKS